ncbi:unnamed protein product [marine sediment metagenome]|uniref:PIN domain-containing protein n=1 Tax=marine sediment metagenome TaxID=412755 RepID=X1GC41_9ZZZZ
MTAKITKRKCVLLDADVVIEAHRISIWQRFVDRLQLIIPSTVIHDEALFFSPMGGGPPVDISLKAALQGGQVIELSATYEELVSLYNIFDRVFIEALHPGETEALALMKANKVEGTFFCTGDGHAIQALAMIGMSTYGISLEALLISIGLKRKLKIQFNETYFKHNLRSGQQNRITRQGLA